MPYLYVLDANKYSKLGKTVDPKTRLKTHAREIGGEVRYTHLWYCSDDSYSLVEVEAKKIASQYDGLTAERFYTSPENLADAILQAASYCKAEVSLIDNPVDKIYCPILCEHGYDRLTFRADIRIEKELLASFQEWLDERLTRQSKTSLCTEALETLKKIDETDEVFLTKEISKIIRDYQNQFDVPPKTQDILENAMANLLAT